jgi:low temperature requirement protein LtrA
MNKIIRPMLARNRDDSHRAATELELLFDLVFVIAIALAAVGLHHSIAEAHYVDGIVKFLLAFFALWWPWMHLTWFASGFDNDDTSYRLSIMVMMFGVILIAGSLPAFFDSLDIRLMAVGYITLRIPYIFLWFRAGKDNPEYKVTAQRYFWGLVLLQCFWVMLAFFIPFGEMIFFVLFGMGSIAELLVPVYASKAKNIPFHKHHIIERFGLLNIIVLGEVLLSAALAIQAMQKSGHWSVELTFVAISATIVPFMLWWLYFNEDENLTSEETGHVFFWSYAHFFIFASAAALGSGFAALADALGDHGHGSADSARWAISLAVAIYVFTVWLIRDRHILKPSEAFQLVIFAVLIALTPLLPVFQLPVLTLLLVVLLALRLRQTSLPASLTS